jgi:3-deoxy-7-phosphoheptulonate synthase
MKYLTDNTRITGLMEVSPPVEVIEKLPISEKVSELVFNSRNEISDILHGNEDRLVVVVGPCSIHDPKAAIEYAKNQERLWVGKVLSTIQTWIIVMMLIKALKWLESFY